MINFNKKKNKNITGFTLVETLVALFIFSVSVLTVMSVLSQGIRSTNYAKNKIIAGYLSQEGVEYFRNMRDTFMLFSFDKDVAWNQFIQKIIDAGCLNGCYFNSDESSFISGGITTLPIFACGSVPCQLLRYESSTGIYGHSSGTETTFSRKMTIYETADNLKITSEVTWGSGSGLNVVSLSGNLTKWME